jgi:hypothetical protein
MSNRAIRRHHKRRMKAKARRIAQNIWGYKVQAWPYWDEEEVQRMLKHAERHADNLAICSCSSCGNPRRYGWEDKTRQEAEFDRSYHEQLEQFERASSDAGSYSGDAEACQSEEDEGREDRAVPDGL